MHHHIIAAVAGSNYSHPGFRAGLSRYFAQVSLRGSDRRMKCSAEQRNNLYLLADQALAFGVVGDFVEVSHNRGSTAHVIASVIDHHSAPATFHLFDNSLDGEAHYPKTLLDPRACGSCTVKLHEGEHEDTLPHELPATIAFAHIDCGQGDPPDLHCQRILYCLRAIYPRMSPGAICMLMDYHDPLRAVSGRDVEPGVKMACDHFLLHKPECMQLLFGGQSSHGFFRKVP
jgi:O-methyltransferase